MSNREIGDKGECYAGRYLLDQGFDIVARNFRVREGEIDIIATKGNRLYFFEVKTRRGNSFGSALESLPVWRIKRMHSAGLMFLSENQEYSDYEIEFTLISIDRGDLTVVPIDIDD